MEAEMEVRDWQEEDQENRPRSGGNRVQPVASGYNKEEGDSGGPDMCAFAIGAVFSILIVILFFPLSLCFSLVIINEYERGVLFRLGQIVRGGAIGPGLRFVFPCIESMNKVDLRTKSFNVPSQEILTKDSVSVSVDAVVYFRIQDAVMSVANVENCTTSTQLLASTTLRNVLGTKSLSEILSDRESICEFMESSLDESTAPWGVKVERVEMKDVSLPQQLQRAMAAEAEASREAKAKVITAEGEMKASLALKEAADIMIQSPAAIQLRYLQTLSSVSAQRNETIIFPLPADVIMKLLKRK